MSKYKLRWMQDFEINNMDFDNLGLAIKMLITLDDGATLTVTEPTGIINGYHKVEGKIRCEREDLVCNDSGHLENTEDTGTLDSPTRLDAFTRLTNPHESHGIDFNELRRKVQTATGIPPQDMLDCNTNVTATSLLDQIRTRQVEEQLKHNVLQERLSIIPRISWYDTSAVVPARTSQSIFAPILA